MSTLNLIRKYITIPLWLYKDRSPRLSYLKEMEKSQYYSLAEQKEHQFLKLKNMLEHAYENTRYYKEKFDQYGIHPKGIVDQSDYKTIPFLTKKDIQRNPEKIVSSNLTKEKLIPFKTGGSTGKSVTTFWDFKAMEKGIGAALRSFKWAGWDIGEAWGRVWGNPPDNKTIIEKLRNLLISPQIFLNTMNLNDKTMLDFVLEWKKTKPTLLHGHSHSLYMFAAFCKKKGIEDIRPKGIISTSMMLMPKERVAIEDVFKRKVTDLYGCEEVGLIACECEKHQGMHINMENVHVEIVDPQGNDVMPGDVGTIVVTSLINRAMPLIRYKVEDMGIPLEKECTCGRKLPLLEGIIGRVADFLVRKDGGLVAGVSLVERTLTAIPGIEQMQIVQEDRGNITINLVKNELYGSETTATLISELKNSLGTDTNISICFLSRIEPEATGKYRFSISRVKNPYKDSQQ